MWADKHQTFYDFLHILLENLQSYAHPSNPMRITIDISQNQSQPGSLDSTFRLTVVNDCNLETIRNGRDTGTTEMKELLRQIGGSLDVPTREELKLSPHTTVTTIPIDWLPFPE